MIRRVSPGKLDSPEKTEIELRTRIDYLELEEQETPALPMSWGRVKALYRNP